ncbi:unnamed protein product [Mytilus coruscus]|uniref:Uncharacterized protein n=1 Tax=Mytilus coruscus TaxID=42192 RepID=A0A6J8BGU0_MYTCO|nr:unnamed protein product [Mytilus coruscus]
MSESSKSNRGRKRSLTDSARKRNRSIISSKWNKSRVYRGDQYQRWNDLKDGLNVQTHAEVARILLDKESDMSGIEEFCSSAKKNTLEKSTSFINPFDLIIDEDETWLMEDNSSGEELEPSFNFTLRHNNADHLPIEDSDDESDISGDDPADATETMKLME